MKLQPLGERTAIDVLIWLTERPDDLSAFLTATGVNPGDISGLAGTPGFHLALLDFLLAEDARVLAFAADHNLRPESLAAARATLPGGQDPHWT